MRKLIAVAAALAVAAMAAPSAFALPTVNVAEPATKTVNIQASPDVLRDIAESDYFEATYVAYEIGWIGGDINTAEYYQLKARPDVTVEDEVLWHIQCHANGNDKKGCDGGGGGGGDVRVPDQTPYGIEQIYNDGSITATSGGAGVVLGHIDTGVDSSHVDLVNRVVYADSSDNNGHGTHTAGTAAADAGSDDLGIYGVASEASIRSYKVCNMFCSTTDINAAINDCTNSGNRKCDVITFSIGGDSAVDSTLAAIDGFVDAGGIFVAAAGNDGPDLGTIDYPGAYYRTVGVAAIDSTYTVADFSSRGVNDGDGVIEEREVELAAGGVDTHSTLPGDDYGYYSGTSMATPHVAGLALKKWTGNGDSTRDALQTSLTDITKGQHAGTGDDPASGLGLPHV